MLFYQKEEKIEAYETVDTEPPIITLNIDTEIEGYTDFNFRENNRIVVYDNFDKDISPSKVSITYNGNEISNATELPAIGEYELQFSVSDRVGNLATETKSITIIDTTPPTVSLKQEHNRQIIHITKPHEFFIPSYSDLEIFDFSIEKNEAGNTNTESGKSNATTITINDTEEPQVGPFTIDDNDEESYEIEYTISDGIDPTNNKNETKIKRVVKKENFKVYELIYPDVLFYSNGVEAYDNSYKENEVNSISLYNNISGITKPYENTTCFHYSYTYELV